jgi:alpha/beta superfamily hydrolase
MYPAGNLFIPVSHGRLEAIIKEPNDAEKVRGAALVCHPLPTHGGTMHNKVVYRTAAGLLDAGLITLRFNFRGVGASTGEFSNGMGEKEDVQAALDYLSENYPRRPITLAGFSFGSRVGTEVGAADNRVVRLISVGTPTNKYDYAYMQLLRKPILFVHGDKDEFGGLEKVRALVESLPHEANAKLIVFQNCGHFFDDDLNELKTAIQNWTDEQIRREE